jgi:glycosyltransferase involved in cell wall biosynthesis
MLSGISFIIPCFNASNYIEASYAMLSRQTVSNFEMVFVDDGSTDDTLQKIGRLAASNVVVVSQENKGITGARLAGLYAAKYSHVAFVDVDDFVDEDLAQEAMRVFDLNPNVDAVLYDFGYYNEGRFNPFPYEFNLPCSGLELVRNTFPSWRAYTNGVFRKVDAIRGYSEPLPGSTNSDELANRLAIINAREVRKIKSKYYYVVNDKLLTRLQTAWWAKEYFVDVYSDPDIERDMFVYLLQEYCALSLVYASESGKPNGPCSGLWIGKLRVCRKQLLDGFSFRFIRLKDFKKVAFLFFSPLYFYFLSGRNAK